MLVTKIFTFDSAHFLTDYHGKCERMHGHTYKLEVTLEGEVQENGLVMDFVVLKGIVNKHVIDKLDHQNLNDFFDNPSVELVVKWIWDQLKDLFELDVGIKLYELVLWETSTSKVTYNGNLS